MKQFIYIAFAFLLLQSCESKELPLEVIDSEVLFYAEGSLNGEELFLQAGPDNYIVEASAELIEGEISLFNSEFYNSDCENCFEKLSISLTGDDLFSVDTPLSEILPLGTYEFQSPEEETVLQDSYDFFLESGTFTVMNDQGFEYFSGNGIYQLEPGFYEYTVIIDEDSPECLGSVSSGFFISEEGELCHYQIHFIEEDGEIFLDFSDFEDELILIEVNGVVSSLLGQGILSLEELLEESSTDELESLSVFAPGNEDCLFFSLVYMFEPDFSFCGAELIIEQATEFIERSPSSAIITYANADGEEFYSSLDFPEDNFELLGLEFYGDDPLGRESYRAHIRFLATLKNTNNPSNLIFLDIEEAYIPVVVE
jgi:hypothetical protein